MVRKHCIRGGLNVITSLDYGVQQQAEQIARDQVAKLQAEKRNVTNASVVVMKPGTGEIVAMVGSVDYFNRDIDGQVNVSLAPRQPGSSFKIFNVPHRVCARVHRRVEC